MIRLLGVVGVVDPVGGEPTNVGGRVSGAVLAFLALARGRTVSVEGLVDQVWDEPTESARNAVQVAVSKLRKVVGAELIAGGRDGYRLRTDLVAVDWVDAELLAGQARTALGAGEVTGAAVAAAGGLALFAGEPLGGVDSQAGSVARQAAVDLRTDLVLLQGEALLRAGRAGEAVPSLREEVSVQPFGEAAHALLMDALLADGRAAEALEVHDLLKARLVEELGLDPSPVVGAAFTRVLDNTPRHPTGRTGGGSVPMAGVRQLRARPIPAPATPLVGRADEIEVVLGLFGQGHRLVTLTGPGGMGKTRLALGVGQAVTVRTGRPVVFVDLRSGSTVEELLFAVAAAVDVSVEHVLNALESTGAVLVLDNAEHALEAVAEVATQVLVEPSIAVLVTSRRNLPLADSRAVPVGPLPSRGVGSESMRLLSDRAGLPTVLGEQVEADLLGLVGLADGHPLTLELIAAALAWTPPGELVQQLAEDMAGLHDESPGRPQRHTSLAAALGWSVGQLSLVARDGLGALTVFRGAFDLPAATAVLASLPDAAPRGVLSELLDHSLIQRTRDPGTIAFTLLEPVRLGVLSAGLVSQTTPGAHDAHAEHYLGQVPELGDPPPTSGLGQAHFVTNLLQAVDWTWTHNPSALTPLMSHVLTTLFLGGSERQADDWGRTVINTTQGTDRDRAEIAVCLLHSPGFLDEASEREFSTLVGFAQTHAGLLDDQWHDLWISSQIHASRRWGDLTAASSWLQQLRPPRDGDWGWRVITESSLLVDQGRYEAALDLLADVVTDAADADADAGKRLVHARACIQLGWVALALGQLEAARSWIDQAEGALARFGGGDDYSNEMNRAWLLLETGDHQGALAIAEKVADLWSDMDRLALADVSSVAGRAFVGLGRVEAGRRAATIALSCTEGRHDFDPFFRQHLEQLTRATGATNVAGTPLGVTHLRGLLRDESQALPKIPQDE